MESIGEIISTAIEFPIDFEGQKKAQHNLSVFLYVSIIASVLSGFLTQNIFNVLYIFVACIAAAAVVILPPWSAYRKNPVQWLQVKYDL